jgi:hypothetical protein
MKTMILSIVVLLAGAGFAFSDEASFVAALRDLPPKYLGDIPLGNRNLLIAEVAKDERRMDAASGWLHWLSDGGKVAGTSMVWAKELPRAGKGPLILVHMAKPFADGQEPAKNQTFVLERGAKGWTDVTKEMIPAEVDLTQHFRTRKKDAVVEVARWTKFERRDGLGMAWKFGPRVLDLHWTGERFIVKEAESDVLTRN